MADVFEKKKNQSISGFGRTLVIGLMVFGYAFCLLSWLAMRFLRNNVQCPSSGRPIAIVIHPWITEWVNFGVVMSLILLIGLPLFVSASKLFRKNWPCWVLSILGLIAFGFPSLILFFGRVSMDPITPVTGIDHRRYGVMSFGALQGGESALIRETDSLWYGSVWEFLAEGLYTDCGPAMTTVVFPANFKEESDQKQLDVSDTGWVVLHKDGVCYMAYHIESGTGYGDAKGRSYFQDIEEISPFVLIGAKDRLPSGVSRIDLSSLSKDRLLQDKNHPNPEVRRIVQRFLGTGKIKTLQTRPSGKE